VNPEDLRRFARRDWGAAEDSKGDYWTEQYRTHGSAPAWLASVALLQHMRAVQPDYPSASDRAEDLAHHQSFRDRLDRAAFAFIRR